MTKVDEDDQRAIQDALLFVFSLYVRVSVSPAYPLSRNLNLKVQGNQTTQVTRYQIVIHPTTKAAVSAKHPVLAQWGRRIESMSIISPGKVNP